MIGRWFVVTHNLARDENVNGFSPGERAEISEEPVNLLTEFSFKR